MVLNHPEKNKLTTIEEIEEVGKKIAPVTLWIASNLSIGFSVQKT